MNEQIDQNENDDTEAHLYIPKDERAGSGADTEGHKHRFKGVDDADENDMITDTDTEGHGRRFPGEAEVVADTDGHGRRIPRESEMVADTDGHKRRHKVEDADEGDVAGDVEGHASQVPGDPVNEPSAVRGRDGQGRR